MALPYIAGTLAASSDEATYALTAYLVANGIVLTIAGWLSDTIGRKRYFLICLVAFTICSFLCGISSSLAELVVFRLFQGFFGGGLQPNQQAIILDTFPPARRSAAFAVTAIATIVAPVLGPTLGGYLIEHLDWRWIFFVNIPFGAVAVFSNFILVEDPPWEKEKQKKKTKGIDYFGLALITLGLGCMQVMIDRGEDDDWFGSSFIVIMALLAFIGIFGAICWLLTAKKPIIDLEVFKDRNFAMGCVLIGAMGMILYASAVLIPQFSQQQLGYTALLSGLILSPGGVVVIILIPIVGQLMKVVQTRWIVMIGFTIMGLALMYSSYLVPQHQLRHAGRDAIVPDGGPGLPVRADLHHRLSDIAADDAQRRRGPVFHVPQCGRRDRHLDRHGAGDRAPSGRPGSPVGLHDAVEPGLQHAGAADRAELAHARSRRGLGARPGRVAHLPDLPEPSRRAGLQQTCSSIPRWVAFCVVPFCFLISKKKASGGGEGGH